MEECTVCGALSHRTWWHSYWVDGTQRHTALILPLWNGDNCMWKWNIKIPFPLYRMTGFPTFLKETLLIIYLVMCKICFVSVFIEFSFQWFLIIFNVQFYLTCCDASRCASPLIPTVFMCSNLDQYQCDILNIYVRAFWVI